VPAITIVGIVLACIAFLLRLIEWLGIRTQTVQQTLSRGVVRVVLAILAAYDLFLLVNTLSARRPSDFLWWAMVVLFLWTIFTLVRVLVPKKPVQILSNVASSASVLYLTAISWRLSEDWRFPLALSIMTAVWLVTLLVEAGYAIRGRENSE
jgi:hypothetical protein